jgi:hypothetical protein
MKVKLRVETRRGWGARIRRRARVCLCQHRTNLSALLMFAQGLTKLLATSRRLSGQRTLQFSVARKRVAEVRHWLSNYQELKEAIECAQSVPHQRSEASSMIEMRRKQLSFGDGLIAEEVSDLRDCARSDDGPAWLAHSPMGSPHSISPPPSCGTSALFLPAIPALLSRA